MASKLEIDLDRMPPSAMVLLSRALDEAAEFSGGPMMTEAEYSNAAEYWDKLRQDVDNALGELWMPNQISRTLRFMFRKAYRKTFLEGALE
jgi:hypothetical protein